MVSVKHFLSDVANSTVRFDEKGDGLARYTIYNYKKNPDNTTDYKVSMINGLICIRSSHSGLGNLTSLINYNYF